MTAVATSFSHPPRSTSRIRLRWLAAGVATLALLLSACGSSPTPNTTTTVHQSATAEITSSWVTFFAGETSAAKKIAALENGSEFSKIISNQVGSALAKSVRATVSKVSDVSASSATVTYSLYLGSTVALSDQTGKAVFQGGSWKVSDASFCVLLGLEQVSSPACPKA